MSRESEHDSAAPSARTLALRTRVIRFSMVCLLGAPACAGQGGADGDVVSGAVGEPGMDIQVTDIGPICRECSTNPCTPLTPGPDGVCRPTVQEGRPCGKVGVKACNDDAFLPVPGICDAKGVCVGRPDKVNICDNPCVESPHCDASGQCTGTLLPSGTACGYSEACKTRSCDGQGHCLSKFAAPGAACGGGSKYACIKVGCDGNGYCVESPAVGNPCKSTAVCQTEAGVCAADFQCTGAPLANGTPCSNGDSSQACKAGTCGGAKNACDDDNPCTFDLPCGNPQPPGSNACAGKASGTCAHVVRTGEACPTPMTEESACSTSTCSAKGVCNTVRDSAPPSNGDICCSWGCDMGGWQLYCPPKTPCAPEPNPCMVAESYSCVGPSVCFSKPVADGTPCGTCGTCEKGECTGSF